MTKKTTWMLFLVLVLFIYGTLPLMRDVVNAAKNWGVIDPVTYGINVAGLLGIGGLLWKDRDLMNWKNYAALLAIALVVLGGILWVRWPSERIHFLEYGVLGAIAFAGFRFDHGRYTSLVAASLLVGGVGWLDEGIQYLLPRRHYNNHDVAINVLSGFLGGLTVLWGLPGLDPRRSREDEAG